MSNQWLRLLRRYAIPPLRLFLTPLGIDLGLFKAQPESPRPGRTLVGAAGRLYPDGRKGEALLLEVARRLRPPDVAFSLIGTRWEEVAAALKAQGFDVRYHRDVPAAQLPARFAELDALLVCSRREGGPVTALEALASGTPVISTPVGYVPELLAACPEGGRLFSRPDEAARWIGTARGLKLQMRSAYPGIRRHLETYGWPAFTSHIARLVETCAAKKVHPP
jgi:glycosyltransferase involved in cell wall biosynthesis